MKKFKKRLEDKMSDITKNNEGKNVVINACC